MYDIIDCHAHIYPDKVAMKATQAISRFYNVDMAEKNGKVENLIKAGNEAGIKKFLVNSVATTPKQVASINNFIFGECQKYPDRFIGFMAMHPDLENPINEIERARSIGLKGVKIHPDIQGFVMDDERMYPIYDYIQDKIPILIHCGDYRYDLSHPKRLKKILKMFPHLTVIAAHFGGWTLYDLAAEYLVDEENCFIDTSSSFAYTGAVRARELIGKYGIERVLFGVDFPMWNPKDELDFFYSLKLGDEANKKILHDNITNLLNL